MLVAAVASGCLVRRLEDDEVDEDVDGVGDAAYASMSNK